MPKKGSWIIAWREDIAEELDKLAELGARDKTGDVNIEFDAISASWKSNSHPKTPSTKCSNNIAEHTVISMSQSRKVLRGFFRFGGFWDFFWITSVTHFTLQQP